MLAGATALVSLVGVADAGAVKGWYASIEGGANWVDDVDQLQVLGGGTRYNQHFDLDAGWGVFATIGRALDEHWRVEAEGGYRENKLHHFTGTHGTNAYPDATQSEFTLMANVVYDIAFDQRWSLSLGAGVGADMGHTTSKTQGYDDSEWSFAYQGLVGINYAMGERSALFVNFRYLAVDGFEYADPSLVSGTLRQDDIRKATVTVGFRFALAPPGP
jgi:opacity protein-like surface antigen